MKQLCTGWISQKKIVFKYHNWVSLSIAKSISVLESKIVLKFLILYGIKLEFARDADFVSKLIFTFPLCHLVMHHFMS